MSVYERMLRDKDMLFQAARKYEGYFFRDYGHDAITTGSAERVIRRYCEINTAEGAYMEDRIEAAIRFVEDYWPTER